MVGENKMKMGWMFC